MRHALLAPAVLLAFVLSGCGVSGISSTPGTQPALPAAPQIQQRAANVKPNVTSQTLLYVADSNPSQMPGTVKMYFYPSLKHFVDITGPSPSHNFNDPIFMCLGKKNSVYVVDYASGEVTHFNHAATSTAEPPLNVTLPYQCVYNRATKDLAVVGNIESPSEHIGYIAMFHNGRGTPHFYYDRDASILTGIVYNPVNQKYYVDGYAGAGDTFYYAALNMPESTFDPISLQGGTPGAAGAMYFDPFNNYIDIGDFATKIYQIPATTPNTVAHVVTVGVPGSSSNGFFVPSKKRIIVADAFAQQVLLFKYPHGGTSVGGIATGLNAPWDPLVSKP